MKRINLFYWVFTALFAGFMLFSAIPDIMVVQPAIEMVSNQLGYPQYLIRFLGVAKLLGAVAILIPGFPRLKEWAYAGLFFDLAGALYSSIAVGTPATQWGFMALPFGLLAGSYYFYHRRLEARQLNEPVKTM